MELHPQALPLYTFAQINSSFIQSAWRLQGGGSQIADALIRSIEGNGGTVRLNARVTRLMEENGRIAAAEINGAPSRHPENAAVTPCAAAEQIEAERVMSCDSAEQIEADYFISNLHPAATLPLITESAIIRNIYRKRINNLTNTFGMFTVNVALKENAVPYRNRNIYVYKTGDVWQYAEYRPENAGACALVSFQPPAGNSPYTRNIDILTPMYWPEVERWESTAVGRRGAGYASFKEQKAKACIRLASEHIPELNAAAIEKTYASTPLSYRDYTATPYGSAYGIRKNCEQLMTTLLSPRTPEPNLFLTGQNLNLHGVLGVSMTSFLTCAEIIGMDAATEGLF
jgi:phytoene dehydrogenase-like protein